MKPRKSKEMRTVLEQKGFVPAKRAHVFMFLHVNGKKTSVRTMVSHGVKEYGDNLLKQVARQLHLTSGELDGLFDCPLTGAKYVSLLSEKGVLKN